MKILLFVVAMFVVAMSVASANIPFPKNSTPTPAQVKAFAATAAFKVPGCRAMGRAYQRLLKNPNDRTDINIEAASSRVCLNLVRTETLNTNAQYLPQYILIISCIWIDNAVLAGEEHQINACVGIPQIIRPPWLDPDPTDEAGELFFARAVGPWRRGKWNSTDSLSRGNVSTRSSQRATADGGARCAQMSMRPAFPARSRTKGRRWSLIPIRRSVDS